VSVTAPGTKRETRLRGVPASPLIAIGRAISIDSSSSSAPLRRIEPEEIEIEIDRFDRALQVAENELREVQTRFTSVSPGDPSLIVLAHLLILRDPLLVDGTRARIKNDQLSADSALRQTLAGLARSFDSIGDDYLRARKSDVSFVGERLFRILAGDEPTPEAPGPDAIIITHDLSPADAAALRGQVAGFATESGGSTSHTAIVARALELPAVVGVKDLCQVAAVGDTVVVDGLRGEVLVNPSPRKLAEYEARRAQYQALGREFAKVRDLPAETPDGQRFLLLANLELVDEVPGIRAHGAEGVGLFRTEFLYMNRDGLPTEKEHLAFARETLAAASPFPVTFRTLDLGGDKLIDPDHFAGEGLGAMRLRAIRLCLQRPEIFTPQLRGLLRASPGHAARLMFPLITGLGEFRAARAFVEGVRENLGAEGVDIPPIPIGAMIETPAAVLVADVLAREANFFCVGTNDLIQYTLAVDRADEAVAHYYRPLHPAILRMLKWIIDAARAANIPASVCGEMAGEPLYTPILMGLGFREFSMNASAIPAVKHVIRNLPLADATALSLRLLALNTVQENESLVRAFMKERFPALVAA
jgi:phosphotransferase system enzyme I (PtsI)